MQGLVWNGATTVEVTEVPSPDPTPAELLVEPAFVGLCGTDLHICAGEHPRAKPGLILGHEIVGRLARAGAGLGAGAPVFVNPLRACGRCEPCCRGREQVCAELRLIGIDTPGGAAELLAVGAEQCVPLPDTLALDRAAILEPLAVAVRAIRRSGLRFNERVQVVGGGPVGLLVAACARLAGATEVALAEPAPDRARRAENAGLRLVDPESPLGLADVVFDCTGSPAVSPSVLGWAQSGGTVVTVGAYPGLVPFDLQAVMFRELTVLGTRVYRAEDVAAALQLLVNERIDPGLVVTSVLPLTEGAEAIDRLRSGREAKVLLRTGRP